jgi:hypothetical protein
MTPSPLCANKVSLVVRLLLKDGKDSVIRERVHVAPDPRLHHDTLKRPVKVKGAAFKAIL